ncbi:MAG: hypothetical protein V4548_00090 [Bacteroidota bacterium]
MQTITNNKTLCEAIAQLESVKASQLSLLKHHYKFTVDSLNPINIIKEKINETFTSPNLKSNLFKTGLGIVTGLLTNKFIVGPSGGIVKKIVGGLVQSNLSKLTTVDPEEMKESGKSFLKNVLSKMKIK